MSGPGPAARPTPPPADPRLPAAYAPRPATTPDRAADPLRFCVFTTVALLAWLLGPPVIVAAMAALGLRAYVRAMRAGATETRCVLRRPALVAAYLGVALALSLGFIARALLAAAGLPRP